MGYKLIKFESGTCGYCKSMDKTKVLEKFAAKNPDVQVLKCMISDDKGVPYLDGEKWATAYGINALPTLVVEDSNGRELAREEGALPVSALEQLMARARHREALGAMGADAGGPASAKSREKGGTA